MDFPGVLNAIKKKSLIVIVAIVLMSVVGGIVYYRHDREATLAEKHKELKAIGDFKVSQIEQWYTERYSEAVFFSSKPPYIDYLKEIAGGDSLAKELYTKSISHVASDNRYANILILSTYGELIYSFDSIFAQVDSMTIDAANKAIRLKKVVVRDLCYNNEFKRLIYELVAPVLSDNNVIATVVFRIDPHEYLFPLIEKWPDPNQTAESYLITVQNDSVYYLSYLRYLDNSRLELAKSFNEQLEFEYSGGKILVGNYSRKDYRGESVLSHIKKINNTSWYLVSDIDSHEVMSEFEERMLMLTMLFTLIVLLVGSLMIAIHHYKQRQLQVDLYDKRFKLYQSQEELWATLYSIGDGVITTDTNGIIKEINPIAENIVGRTKFEAAGKPFEEIFTIVDEKTFQAVENSIMPVLKGLAKGEKNKNILLNSYTGEIKTINISVNPIKDFNGNIIGAVIVFSDKTQQVLRQKIIETRLRFTEFINTHKLDETLEFMISEICSIFNCELGSINIVDPVKKQIVKQAWCMSLSDKYTMNKNTDLLYDVWGKSAIEKCFDQKKTLLINNKQSNNALTDFCGNKLIVPVVKSQKLVAFITLCNSQISFSETNISAYEYLADVAWESCKNKMQQDELIESEERYRLVLDNSLDAILLSNPNGDILDMNNAALRLFAYTEDEIKTLKRKDIVDENDPALQELIQKRSIEGSVKGIVTFIKSNGSKFPAEFSSSVFTTSNGEMRTSIVVRDITDRLSAEEIILKERMLLRILIDNLPDAIYVKDAEGRKLIANKADLQIMGFETEEEALGKTDLDIFKTDNGKNGYYEDMDVIRNDKTFINKEDSYVDAAGNTHWRLISKIPLHNDEGEVIGLVGFGRDFTSRQIAEQQLAESEETIRLLFNSTAEGIYGIDKDGKCTFCNKAALLLLGYQSEDEYIGKDMHKLIHHSYVDGKEMPDSECNIHKAYLEGVKAHKEDEVFWKKDGSPVPVEYWSYPIERNSSIIGSVVTFINIEQRKYDEKVQQILFEIAYRSMSAKCIEELLVFVRDNLSGIIDTSSFYVALYDETKQMLEKVLFSPDYHTLTRWTVNNSLTGDVVKARKTIILNDAEIVEIAAKYKKPRNYKPAKNWMGVPLLDKQTVVGVMVFKNYDQTRKYTQNDARLVEMIAHELTIVIQRNSMIEDLIAAKEKAEENDRLKSAFLANISHEIRTPMNGILGFLELLSEHNVEDDKREKYLEIMNKSGARLLDTINDIIEISKIDSGQISVSETTIQLDELMNDHLLFFNQLALRKNIRLTLGEHISENKGKILSDKFKIDAILTNLLNNAVKYTNEGSIEFGNYIEDDYIVFFVKDTGIGIKESKIDAIFERFIQDEQYITRPQEGVGLGLAIVKGYIDALHGDIWVQSKVNVGSQFYFKIPYRKA